jgi:hypothetical protein
MAKAAKAKVNISKVVREAIADNPTIGNIELSAQLAKKGIKATPGYISNIKTASKNGKAAKTPKGKRGRKAKTQDQIDVAAVDRFAKEAREKAAMRNGDAMLLAVELAKEIGVDNAITMLGTLKGIK